MISGKKFGQVISIFALIAPFFFPWKYVVLFAVVASVWNPPVALAVGLLFDAIYFVHGASIIPVESVWGFVIMLISLLMRRLARTYLFVS
ncbi:MAG TPA: hypothetical protein ENJ75_01015 [Candidatus Kaiserbacteria bacterium]|nr:hypothetical protein [Candidatus Kaiserbacteria bacterium]